jgi:glycosyltransferase involved in cell wall biosynthesis
VLPSLYEGFGLPVLEAMKSGTPVVASDIAPLREVAGDAALYVTQPLDRGAWRAALARISTDASLRAELSRRGVPAAEQFSWPHVGERFSDLLHRVAATGSLARPGSPRWGMPADGPRSRTAGSRAAGVRAEAEPAE